MRYASSYQYTFFYTLLFFVIDFVLYFLIGIYLDNVMPNAGGTRRHPLYFLLPSYWCKSQKQQLGHQEPLIESDEDPFNEKVNDQLKSNESESNTIQLTNLTKKFDDFVAVNNISMTMYPGQIFALLGQNGAGKTTTISMLSGLLDITKGKINVFGKDTVIDSDVLKGSIGLCPQNDIIFNNLTVEEHFYVIGAFKGLNSINTQAESRKLIAEFGLQDKARCLAKQLSGGQKRRLALCLAFLGSPKLVLLDEPTSGLDTTGRRELWDRLKEYKKDRVILLTTHYMEEADFLGDRIAIMVNGKIKVSGSSLFLKSKFGIGYVLQVETKGSHKELDILMEQLTGNKEKIKETKNGVEYSIPFNSIRYLI